MIPIVPNTLKGWAVSPKAPSPVCVCAGYSNLVRNSVPHLSCRFVCFVVPQLPFPRPAFECLPGARPKGDDKTRQITTKYDKIRQADRQEAPEREIPERFSAFYL